MYSPVGGWHGYFFVTRAATLENSATQNDFFCDDGSKIYHGRIQDSPLHPVFSEDDLELKIEYLDDFKAPEVSAEELKNLRSGISIFKSQAACGFQAFAKFRLNIKEIRIARMIVANQSFSAIPRMRVE